MEEILHDGLMFILTDNNICAYREALVCAQKVELDRMLSDSAMLRFIEFPENHPGLSFARLIKPGDFIGSALDLKADAYEFMNKAAALALNKDNVDTHYWNGHSRVCCKDC